MIPHGPIYIPHDLSTLVGISYRQVGYWDNTGFLKPSYKKKERFRMYTFMDMFDAHIAKSLLDDNVSIQRQRSIMKSLHDLRQQWKGTFYEAKVLITNLHKRDKNGYHPSIFLYNREVVHNYTNPWEAPLKFHPKKFLLKRVFEELEKGTLSKYARDAHTTELLELGWKSLAEAKETLEAGA